MLTQSYMFNDFALKVHPTCLFHTARLFDTQECLQLFDFINVHNSAKSIDFY